MLTRLAPALLLAAGSAIAAPGGKIDALDAGTYVCELPGDAAGAAGIRQPDAAFDIVNANTYRTATGRGAYLLTGDTLVMTSGPKNGQRFHRISDRFLRLIGPDGQDGPLRCIRRVVNNG
ncbi:hypothetical protein ACFFF7_15780 [Novosphingobium aquiterrae]|uniref:Elongation factor P n=1 Tax=Novosphingobium aquiterrae TaxID=624388 RepID=A0ABV6PM14_9SPHN